jgi:hypothetical protein
MIGTFPPNVPRRLIREYRKQGAFHRLADALGVNVAYVHRLLVQGIEPVNGDIRVKLFLPRKPKSSRPRRPRKVFHEDLRDGQIHLRK